MSLFHFDRYLKEEKDSKTGSVNNYTSALGVVRDVQMNVLSPVFSKWHSSTAPKWGCTVANVLGEAPSRTASDSILVFDAAVP